MVSTIGSYLDIFLLNYFIEDRVGFGYYSIATIFIIGMNYVTMTVQNIAAPYFSEKSGDRVEFVRVLKKYQKQLVILSLVVTVLAIIVVPYIIVMFYGSEYASAGKYFRILALKYVMPYWVWQSWDWGK